MVRGLWIDIFHEKSGCRFVKDSDIVSGRICCLYYGHQLSPGIRVTAAAGDNAGRGGFRPERSRVISEQILDQWFRNRSSKIKKRIREYLQ